MSRPKNPIQHTLVSANIPREWLSGADTLAVNLSRPGFSISRSQVIRAAIQRGLDVLKQELEAETAAKPKKVKGRT